MHCYFVQEICKIFIFWNIGVAGADEATTDCTESTTSFNSKLLVISKNYIFGLIIVVKGYICICVHPIFWSTLCIRTVYESIC